MLRARLAIVMVLALPLAGCASGSDGPSEPRGARMPAQEEKVPSQPPKVEPWVAGSGEDQAEAKELAARIAQTALRYPRGSSALEVAERVAGPGAPAKALAPTISAAVRPQWRSWARVVYPQLSGLGIDTVGTMVVVDQTVESPAGDRTTFRRVLDIRLRRAGEGYALDLLGSIGGDPVQRPADLSPAASRIVDDPRITLSDSARWDIYRGKVDDGLIEAILAIAERHTVAIGPLVSGHPLNVWETARVSAHSQGLAADIYAVDGELVAEQRSSSATAANQIAAGFLEGGAVQVGSPLLVAEAGVRSLTDGVHQDHVHVQQSSAAAP